MSVAAGTYTYNNVWIQFTKSGSSGSPITVQCATRGACLLHTNDVEGTRWFIEIDSNYFVLDGFDIADTASGINENFGVLDFGSNVTIPHNVVHDWHTACTDNGGAGISASGSATNVAMNANVIMTSAGDIRLVRRLPKPKPMV